MMDIFKTKVEMTNARIAQIDKELIQLEQVRLDWTAKQLADKDETIKRLRAELARVEAEMGLMR